MPSTTLVRLSDQRPARSVPTQARRVVTWAVPVGTHTLLGGASIGGLAWLLGVRRQSDALAVVLRRAMSIDAEADQ